MERTSLAGAHAHLVHERHGAGAHALPDRGGTSGALRRRRASATRPPRPAARERDDPPPPRAPLTVLLVDDDLGAARRLHGVLREAGLDVRAFTRGQAALVQAAHDPPDVAILALELPDITGFEASRTLRDHARTRNVPIVLLAPRDERRSRAAAYAAGADSVLTRPVGADELLAVVLSLGARRVARDPRDHERPAASVAALRVALELHPGDARAHGLRVGQLARATGRHLGLRPAALRTLTLAAELHDVGVLALGCARSTTTPALAEAQDDAGPHPHRHAALGARMLAAIPSLDAVREVVRHHHERWDGRGRPDGLAGERIPALARLLSVLDRFDSLRNGRAGPRLGPTGALGVLRAETRNGRFDPALLEAFEDALRSGSVRPGRERHAG